MSELSIHLYLFLACLSGLPLFVPGLRTVYDPSSTETNVFFYSFLCSFGSFCASIPMILDLYLDREHPWADLIPRALLTGSQILPNGIVLLVYFSGYSDKYFHTVLVCSMYMRLNIMRGTMMSNLTRYVDKQPITSFSRTWVAIAAVVTTIHQISFFIPRPFPPLFDHIVRVSSILMWGAIVLFVNNFAVYFRAIYLDLSPSAEDKRFRFYFAVVWVVNAVAKEHAFTVDQSYFFLWSTIIDAVVAIAGFYVSGKIFRSEHYRMMAALDLKRSFIRHIAHEIRTPLNTSSIGLQLALNELGKKTYDTEDNLRAALAAVEEATEILNDLLLADKLDSGHMIAEREEIDVMSIVRKTFHIFNVQARSKQIMYTLNAETELDAVILNVDRKKYSQVIKNFISNAMKFTPVGGSVSVNAFLRRTGCGDNNPVFRVEVVDSGVGIKPPDLKRLFHEVVQFDTARLQAGGGSGLGLTIVKAIMDAHGGKVECSSNYGRGSTFAAELSVLRIEKQSRTATGQCSFNLRPRSLSRQYSSEFRNIDSSESRKRRKVGRVLVVDDSRISAKMMKSLLKGHAEEVLIAYDGATAAEVIVKSLVTDEKPIDIVLTDYHMPNMDGVQMTHLVRSRGFAGFMVLLSGDSSEELMELFANQGGNHIVMKPLRGGDVLRILDIFWEQSFRPDSEPNSIFPLENVGTPP